MTFFRILVCFQVCFLFAETSQTFSDELLLAVSRGRDVFDGRSPETSIVRFDTSMQDFADSTVLRSNLFFVDSLAVNHNGVVFYPGSPGAIEAMDVEPVNL